MNNHPENDSTSAVFHFFLCQNNIIQCSFVMCDMEHLAGNETIPTCLGSLEFLILATGPSYLFQPSFSVKF